MKLVGCTIQQPDIQFSSYTSCFVLTSHLSAREGQPIIENGTSLMKLTRNLKVKKSNATTFVNEVIVVSLFFI